MMQPEGVPGIKGQITEASVRSWIADKRNQATIGNVGQDVKITGVQFISAGQVKAVLHENSLDSFPTDAPFVYVTMAGNFADESAVMHTAFVVFDARSGNLIMSGAK